MEAAGERAEYDHQARVWLAFHTGVMVRSDNPPSFVELGGKLPEPEPQSDGDMLFALKAICIATGGTIDG